MMYLRLSCICCNEALPNPEGDTKHLAGRGMAGDVLLNTSLIMSLPNGSSSYCSLDRDGQNNVLISRPRSAVSDTLSCSALVSCSIFIKILILWQVYFPTRISGVITWFPGPRFWHGVLPLVLLVFSCSEVGRGCSPESLKCLAYTSLFASSCVSHVYHGMIIFYLASMYQSINQNQSIWIIFKRCISKQQCFSCLLWNLDICTRSKLSITIFWKF